MRKILIYSFKAFLVLIFVSFNSYKVSGQELESVLQQLEVLQKDIKTLEKAIYSQNVAGTNSNIELSNNDSDVLTKHLLKLSELEDQFKILTNSFEEINFKLDKLSNRITKIQRDNQMRFQDIEKSGVTKSDSDLKKQKKLAGSGEAQDLGTALEIGVTSSDIAAAEKIQKTQSIESVGFSCYRKLLKEQKKFFLTVLQKNNINLL